MKFASIFFAAAQALTIDEMTEMVQVTKNTIASYGPTPGQFVKCAKEYVLVVFFLKIEILKSLKITKI